MRAKKFMAETLETIAERITALSASNDARFYAMDKRFDAVDKEFVSVSKAIAEQRAYTEFAFEKLRQELTTQMNGGFSKLDGKADRVLELLTARPRRRRRS